MINIKNILKFYVTHHPAILGLPADTEGTLHMANIKTNEVFWFDNINNEWHKSIYSYTEIAQYKGYKEVSSFYNGYISTRDALYKFVEYYPEYSLTELIYAHDTNLLEEKISLLSTQVKKLEEKLNHSILPKFKVGEKVWWITRGKPYAGKIRSIEFNEGKNYKTLNYHILVNNAYCETLQEKHLFKTKQQAIKNDIKV